MPPTSADSVPCPSPACDNVPSADDRFCEICGTWLGLEGECPPRPGPLARAILRQPAAKRLLVLFERAEANLNDLCR